jgi:hypothetical protein
MIKTRTVQPPAPIDLSSLLLSTLTRPEFDWEVPKRVCSRSAEHDRSLGPRRKRLRKNVRASEVLKGYGFQPRRNSFRS